MAIFSVPLLALILSFNAEIVVNRCDDIAVLGVFKDRYFSPEIENAKKLIVDRSLLDIVDIQLL